MIKLELIDECGEIESCMGNIAIEDLKRLVHTAQYNNFDCLSFIALDTQTWFNIYQVRSIKKEIDQLQKKTNLNPGLLKKIEQACAIALTDSHLYIRFNPENNPH